MVDCIRGGGILHRIEEVEEEEEEKQEEGGESQAGVKQFLCMHMCQYLLHTSVSLCVFLCLHKSWFHSTQPDHDSFFLRESSPFSGTRFAVTSDDFLHVCVCLRERKVEYQTAKNKFPCGLPDAP